MINVSNTLFINTNPSTETEKIARDLQFFCSTIEKTVPFDRDFGINPSFIDKTEEIAKNLVTIEYYNKFQKYFPMITIEQITFIIITENKESKLVPKVVYTVD